MRSLLAFIALPGLVAYAVPALLAAWLPRSSGIAPAGLVPFVIGTTALLWCTVAFHRRGRGTLAPWAPPRHLVTSGLYAGSRNPMYLAVLLVLVGWAFMLRSGWHAAYAVAVALAFHLRVVLGEEPWQARAFAADWPAYRAAVPRWLPPLRRWPWALWLGAGLLLGAGFWLLSPALLGHAEPWDAGAPVWTLSWPVIGALGAAAHHWRGAWLPVGYALGQVAAMVRPPWLSEFGALGALFIGAGLAVALAVTLALLGALALWRRHRAAASSIGGGGN
jgi:protein-S-isoprenylcysteine O-methyltransferase Ste14